MPAGCTAYCMSFYFFNLHSFFFPFLIFSIFGFFSLATRTLLQPVSYRPPSFLSLQPRLHHRHHVELTVVSSKRLFHTGPRVWRFSLCWWWLLLSLAVSHHQQHHHPPAPQRYLNAVYIKGRKLLGGKGPLVCCCKMESLLSLYFYHTFYVPLFFSPCLNLPITLSLSPYSFCSFPFLEQSAGVLPPSLTQSPARAAVVATLSMLPLVPPPPSPPLSLSSQYSAISTFQPRVIPSAWSSFPSN